VLFLADIFPGGGSPLADALSILLAVVLFALLFWAIDLIDRI
jgi:preprotein translocase subunit SecE